MSFQSGFRHPGDDLLAILEIPSVVGMVRIDEQTQSLIIVTPERSVHGQVKAREHGIYVPDALKDEAAEFDEHPIPTGNRLYYSGLTIDIDCPG
jgi:hypothetical protein